MTLAVEALAPWLLFTERFLKSLRLLKFLRFPEYASIHICHGLVALVSSGRGTSRYPLSLKGGQGG